MSETDSETVVEMLNETDEKQNEKDSLRPVISLENQIVTLVAPNVTFFAYLTLTFTSIT
jgi:hypothetical protein